MSNAILLNWVNLSSAISALPKNDQPLGTKALQQVFHDLVEWYRAFTDIADADLKQAAGQYEKTVKEAGKKNSTGLHGAVLSAVAFLRAYQEPAEIINMARFGAGRKERSALASMTGRITSFHVERMKSLDWLVGWLEKNDPLFPSATYRNKLACCFSGVKQKHCFTNSRVCIFEPVLSWIKVPSATFSGATSNDDCCHGATLSSCSGGTLNCDCVAGNTGCDCKAPNKLCEQNNKNVLVAAAGFSDVNCYDLATGEQEPEPGLVNLPCLVFDPVRNSGCMLDRSDMLYRGPLSSLLDAGKGRFMIAASGIPFNLGRLVLQAKDCDQTGFCPPKAPACTGLC
ncbi:hypothetical protein [Prosthecochloris sp.]|uniref:hypothetical protein n=1 Tax=Prosthecochloris sp. TaxID=290513 RepID=UPI0025E1576D|nr:hypothetical protein [Prosthecochloris sp.]